MSNLGDLLITEIVFLIAGPLIAGAGVVVFLIVFIKKQLKIIKKYRSNEFEKVEKERQRIANDMHDQFAGELTVLKCDMESINSQILDERIKLKITGLVNRVGNLHDELREVIEGIYPLGLMTSDVKSSFDWLADELTTYKTKVIMDVHMGLEFSTTVHQHLFRIVQEKISNIIRYQNSSIVQVYLNIEEGIGVLRITYEPTFNSINSVSKVERKGRGERIIAERLKIINGEIIHIKSNDYLQDEIRFKV